MMVIITENVGYKLFNLLIHFQMPHCRDPFVLALKLKRLLLPTTQTTTTTTTKNLSTRLAMVKCAPKTPEDESVENHPPPPPFNPHKQNTK